MPLGSGDPNLPIDQYTHPTDQYTHPTRHNIRRAGWPTLANREYIPTENLHYKAHSRAAATQNTVLMPSTAHILPGLATDLQRKLGDLSVTDDNNVDHSRVQAPLSESESDADADLPAERHNGRSTVTAAQAAAHALLGSRPAAIRSLSRDGYGFRPSSGTSTPLRYSSQPPERASPIPDENGLGWPGEHINYIFVCAIASY